ncbi:MAG: NUDIX hydrolase [Acidiferrobacteraceae bacterium]
MFNYRHPHPAVTTNVVIFTIVDDSLKVLLVRRTRPPFEDAWALPGGFIDLAEDLEDSAMRTLDRETGVRGVYLEQLYTFGQPGRDPRERVIAVSYYTLVPFERVKPRTHDGVGWFALDERPGLAFDHDEIVATAARRLAAKLDYSTIAFGFMPEEFTLSELQHVYEIIQREDIDKRNFRKRVLALNHIEASGERRNGSHRPATLYRLKNPGQIALIK